MWAELGSAIMWAGGSSAGRGSGLFVGSSCVGMAGWWGASVWAVSRLWAGLPVRAGLGSAIMWVKFACCSVGVTFLWMSVMWEG